MPQVITLRIVILSKAKNLNQPTPARKTRLCERSEAIQNQPASQEPTLTQRITPSTLRVRIFLIKIS